MTPTDTYLRHRVAQHSGPLVEVTAASDQSDQFGDAPSTATLPPEFLRYLLPSRYCESDKLFVFAREKFGHIFDAGERVRRRA